MYAIANMSLAQLTLVCCGQEVPSSNPHPSIYYNTFAKKKSMQFVHKISTLNIPLTITRNSWAISHVFVCFSLYLIRTI